MLTPVTETQIKMQQRSRKLKKFPPQVLAVYQKKPKKRFQTKTRLRQLKFPAPQQPLKL